jgi:uncharacterized integral membrane protein
MVRILILLPFLILLVAFALSNPQPVPLGLWPTDFTVELPVSIAVLSASGLFFFLGALFIWFGAQGARARARRAQKRIAALEAELKTRDIIPPAPAPAPAPANRPRLQALAAPR